MKSFSIAVLIILFFSQTAISRDRDSIIYLRTADSTSLDPGKVTTLYNGEVSSNIFEGLVDFDKNRHSIIPSLAIRWESFQNGRKWRFFLRRNVFFHNGERFDSSAVIYSFLNRKKHQDSEYMKWGIFFKDIEKILAPNKYTVDIVLKNPSAPFLALLTDPVAYIVSPGSHKHPNFTPVGTGPFKFEKWEKGKYISISRNNRYWGKPVRIKKVVFRTFSKPGLAVNMIKNGQADVMELKSLELYQNFIGQKKFIITQSPPGGIFFLTFNTKKFPFNNVFFRKGFAHLINKEIMIKTIFQNFVPPAKSPIPFTFDEFNNKISDYEFSVDKAEKLFRKAGIRKGFKCSISYLANDKSERWIFETFRKQAKKTGIILIKDPLPFNKLYKKLKKGDFDLALRGWVAGIDPDIYLYSNFTNIEGNTNFGRYFNTELINILVKARETLDYAKRKKLYFRSQEIIHDEVPWIPLYYSRATVIHLQNIKNIRINSNFFIIFKDVFISDN